MNYLTLPSIDPTPSPLAPPAPPFDPSITLERLQSWLPAIKHYGILTACVIVGVLVLALVLRWKAPRVYWWTFGAHLLRLRMRRTWKSLALNADLTTSDRPRHGILDGLKVPGKSLTPLTPVLCRFRYRWFGAIATVVLLPGQTPDTYIKVADVFAHAWRVHAVRITSPRRGQVLLTVLHRDPLITRESVHNGHEPDRTFSAPAPDANSSDATPEDLRVEVGRREDGLPWVIDLNLYPHWLITGATRSGKSTLINAAVARWCGRSVALVGIDCKGGMELAPVAPRLSALATDREQAAQILQTLLGIAQDRMRLCRERNARNIWQLPQGKRPMPILVIVDELAELYLVAGKEEKESAQRATTALLRLAQLGAALGIHLIVAGQRVGSDLGPGVTALRAQLAGRICHKVNDPETADMTLGDLYPDAVEAAQMISAHERGVAVTTDDREGWIRARSAYLSPPAYEVLVNMHAKRTPTLPGLSRPDLATA